MYTARHLRFLAAAAMASGLWLLAAPAQMANAAAPVIAPGTIDLLATPPELTASVDPNIVVTFDDSGSMTDHFMGDNRPFDNNGWGAPWGCAGTIDARVTTAGDIRAHSMNGVYYNPNVLYVPPVKADGTTMPNADATLAAVWADGIAVNRPRNPVTPAAAAYNGNPDSSGSGSDNKVTNIVGIYTPASTTVTTGSAPGKNAKCPASSGNTTISNCVCTRPGNSSNVCTWTATTTTPAKDNRWSCGIGTYPTAFVDGEDVNAGGPYYYRLKSEVTLSLDTYGNPDTAGRNTLYTAANWEAVHIPNATTTIEGVPTNQWQNFANWYAYYRTRNLMTRSALSRTFSKFGGNVRVAWQNINNGTFKLPATTIITDLLDKAGVSCAGQDPATVFGSASQPDCYRSAFFNWVFATGASGSTPDRASTIRAGNFFKRINTGNLLDPYWQMADADAGTSGRELSCRQNFHMLVTDGYWNEGDPTYTGITSEASRTLPDGTAYSNSAAESRIFWNVNNGGSGIYTSSLANIAFNYWATDLRTDLDNKVKPFVPDKTTGITLAAAPLGADPLANKEVYFNPGNDPATWQHVVQFMVTLGIAGKLNFSDDLDCVNPNNDLCKLRKGQTNSTTAIGWPRPANNSPPAIDDTWHAAINSRGSYFSASNPGELVTHLEAIINSVLARGASSTPLAVSLPVLVGGTTAYAGGYDSSDWSGTLIREDIDPVTGERGLEARWDAGCMLTGGTFDRALRRCTQPSGGPWASPPGYPGTARAPDTRRVFTSIRDASGNGVGIPFRWDAATLGTELVNGLNQKPSDATLCSASNAVACDGFGSQRVNYVRGLRMNEATASPHFRTRSSVLGAIINSKPLYVSSPIAGYYDVFPVGSPEQEASKNDEGYAAYQESERARKPMVYVGSDDGMLHAFDASTGAESWAYVPSTLIQNRRLARSTSDLAGLVPGVDAPPLQQDVFIGGAWRTYLIGSMRLGGRGIFALDVTDVPDSSATEASLASSIVKWEFNSGPTRAPASVPSPDPSCAEDATSCASLGYTYDNTNVTRINRDNAWVVLVSSGYFPSLSGDAANPDDASEPAANRSSLLVINLATGKLIREIRTSLAPQARPTGFKTYGLSTPVVYDLGSDQVADYVYAGDLAGNLWRFDISSPDASQWSVDLMFTTYGDGGATSAGDQPIVFNPTAMTDPVTRRPIVVFGTGKYLGRDDRTSAIPQQAFYGIRDYQGSSAYPIRVNQLVKQTITQGGLDANGVARRTITGYTDPTGTLPSSTSPMIMMAADSITGDPIHVPVAANGWRIPLDITAEPGERAERRAFPDYTRNIVGLYTMIPKGDDPCDPGRRFGVIFLNAATGGALSPTGAGTVGVVLPNEGPIPDPIVEGNGSGGFRIPGLPQPYGDLLKNAINEAAPPTPYHRGAWKELLDLQ